MLTFTQFLNEGRGFELGGKKYSSGFGRYTCDGKSISKEEYLKASAEYKGGKVSSKSIKSMSFDDAMKVKKYKPTKKDLQSRLSEPSVELDKNGNVSVSIPVKMGVDGNLSDGKGFKVTPEYYKDFAWNRYKSALDKHGDTPHVGGFKMSVKHEMTKHMEDWMSSAVMTDKEKENLINDTLDAVFDYIDKNYEDISGDDSKKGNSSKEVIPSKDYHITGGFPGGTEYDVRNKTIEFSYPHRDGVSPAGFTALKFNYSKDSKTLYKFYKSHAEKENKKLSKEGFMDYALKTLWDNVEHTINQYGNKHAKFDMGGIQTKLTDVFRTYIDDNFEKISK